MGRISLVLLCANHSTGAKPSATASSKARKSQLKRWRFSTQQQQRSGLGIEAQRAAIERFAAAESLTIIEEYAEFETGKGADALDRRPQLAAALAAARKAKCS